MALGIKIKGILLRNKLYQGEYLYCIFFKELLSK